jgi:hypothetical protein
MDDDRNKSNQLPDRGLTIRWDGELFQRIQEATQATNEREHLDLTVTGYIRRAVRRDVDLTLGNAA